MRKYRVRRGYTSIVFSSRFLVFFSSKGRLTIVVAVQPVIHEL